MPKISVIVPIYKVEKYLNRCVDSILNQTFTDFECILVDDGSPDNCPKICDEYAKKDKRIKVIHKQNGGLSDARNAGLDLAQGEYIYFLDSDDYIEKNALERLNEVAVTSESDVIVFGYFREYETKNITKSTIFEASDYKFETERDYLDFICKTLLTYKVGWEAWDKLFKRSVISTNGLRFYDNAIIYAEDLHFFLCYLLNIKSIKVIEDTLYHYVIRSDSITGTTNTPKINEYVKLNIDFFNHLKEKELGFMVNNYYTIFYAIMSNRYNQSEHSDVLTEMRNIEDKKFFRKNLLKIIFHGNKMANYFGTSRKGMIIGNIEYLLYISDSFLFKGLRNMYYYYKKKRCNICQK